MRTSRTAAFDIVFGQPAAAAKTIRHTAQTRTQSIEHTLTREPCAAPPNALQSADCTATGFLDAYARIANNPAMFSCAGVALS